MLVCYIDEAGTPAEYCPDEPGSTPVFVLAGVAVEDTHIDDLLMDYIHLKTAYNRALRNRPLSDVIRTEVKGASLRRDIRNPSSRDTRRRALQYLDDVVGLLEHHHCRTMGHVLVKQTGGAMRVSATYPSAVADLAATFNQQAGAVNRRGWMILDSQTKTKNEGNVHTITTRRYRRGGSKYPQLVESPVFGHSDTHVLLQIADILASALLYPCACSAFLPAIPDDPHRDAANRIVRETFGIRLSRLQYHYTDSSGVMRGGFRVIDRVGHQPARLLFQD